VVLFQINLDKIVFFLLPIHCHDITRFPCREDRP